MVSFVESATLRLIDDSSKKIKTINSALNQLFATTRKLKSMRFDIKGLDKAGGQVRRLTSDMQRLQRTQSTLQKLSGTIRINDAAVDRASNKVTRLQAQIRALSGNVAVNVNGRVPPVAPGPQQRPVRVPPVTVNVAPLNTLLNGFVYRLGYTIESAIIRGFKAGTSDLDVASTRLGLQGATPETRSFANEVATSLSREFQTFTRGQTLGVVAEILPIVRGNESAVEPIAREVVRFAEQQVALGATVESAVDSAFKLAKAGEQSGRFTDAQGNVDTAGIQDFFKTLRQGAAQVGKEFTAEMVQGAVKLLRTSKTTLNNEGLLTTLFLAEEQGTTASVGVNQLIKQLTGERAQKKQIANLESLGLIVTTEVETGRVGEDKTFERAAKGSVNDELLRENPLKFVIDEVIPRAREAGFDLSKSSEIARFANSVTSDRTATDALTTLIGRANEIQSQVQLALANQAASAENTQKVLDASLLVATSSALSQFNGLLGEAGNSFKGVLIPALNTTASILQSLGSFIAGPEGEGSPTRTAATALALGAAGLGAVKGGSALLNFFNPLNASATALNGSAAALTRAAVALAGGAAMPGSVPGTGTGAPGTGRGVNAGQVATGLGIAAFIKNALGVGAIAAGAKLALDAARESEQGKTLEQESILPFLREVFEAQKPARDAADAMQRETQRTAATAATQALLEDRATRMRPEDARQVQSIQADSILVKNLSAIERGDRELSAARKLIADTALLEDRATRARPFEVAGAGQQPGMFQTFLDGMESSLATSRAGFDETFATGATTIGSGLTNAAPVAGNAFGASAAMQLGDGSAFGASAAAAFNANVRIPPVTVNNVGNPASFGPVNTGQTTPVE